MIRSAVLGVPAEEFEGIEIINSELLREFAEDRKGILDVRAKKKQGKQIDIEIQIQILPTEFRNPVPDTNLSTYCLACEN